MGHVAGICLSQVSYCMDISSSLVGMGRLDTRMRGMLFPLALGQIYGDSAPFPPRLPLYLPTTPRRVGFCNGEDSGHLSQGLLVPC